MPDTFQRVEWVDEIKKKERDTATRRKKERKKERKEERKKGRERERERETGPMRVTRKFHSTLLAGHKVMALR